MCVYVCVHVHVFVHVCVCTRVHVCLCVCVCVHDTIMVTILLGSLTRRTTVGKTGLTLRKFQANTTSSK